MIKSSALLPYVSLLFRKKNLLFSIIDRLKRKSPLLTYIQHSSTKHEFTSRVANSEDSDEMADLDLQCFQQRINLGSTVQGLRLFIIYNY